MRGRTRIRTVRTKSSRRHRPRVIGSQTFVEASAFNANIGAWNTASVASLRSVCAASGFARTAADCARTVFDACAAVVRGGIAHVCTRARVSVRMQLCM